MGFNNYYAFCTVRCTLCLSSAAVNKSQQHQNKFGNADNRTQNGWAGSANATTVLCRPPCYFGPGGWPVSHLWSLSKPKSTHQTNSGTELFGIVLGQRKGSSSNEAIPGSNQGAVLFPLSSNRNGARIQTRDHSIGDSNCSTVHHLWDFKSEYNFKMLFLIRFQV